MKKILALVDRKTDKLIVTAIDGRDSQIADDSVIGNEYEECVEFVSIILVKKSSDLTDGTPSMIVTIKDENEKEDLKAMGCQHMRVYDSIATLIPRALGTFSRLMA